MLAHGNNGCGAITSGYKSWFQRLFKDDFKGLICTYCVVDFKTRCF